MLIWGSGSCRDEQLEQVPVRVVEVDPCLASERVIRLPVGRVAWIVAEWHAALAEPADGAGEHWPGYPEGDVMGLVSRQSEVGEGAVPDAEAGHLAVWSLGRYLTFGQDLAEEPGRGSGIGCGNADVIDRDAHCWPSWS